MNDGESEYPQPTTSTTPEALLALLHNANAADTRQCSDSELVDIQCYVVREPPRGTFPRFHRPVSSTSPVTNFYTLTSDATTVIEDAVGVLVGADKVVIAVAIADPTMKFEDPKAANVLWEYSARTQVDIFGAAKRTDCRNGRSCSREGCHFYHGPGDAKYRHVSNRTTPTELRRHGAGFTFTHCTWAMVLYAEYPLQQGTSVDWNLPAKVYFQYDAVPPLSDRLTDDVLEDISFGRDASRRLTKTEAAAAMLKKFCEGVSLSASRLGRTFEGHYDAAATRVTVNNTPKYNQKDGRLEEALRHCMTVRRFMSDATTDFFNYYAARELLESNGQAMFKIYHFTPELLEAVGIEDVQVAQSIPPYKLLPNAPISMRMMFHSLQERAIVYQDQLETALKDPSDPRAVPVPYAKFTTPFRDFQCLYNLLLLGRRYCEQINEHAGQLVDFAVYNVDAFNERRQALLTVEKNKLDRIAENKRTTPCIAVLLHDKMNALLLGNGVVKLVATEELDEPTADFQQYESRM